MIALNRKQRRTLASLTRRNKWGYAFRLGLITV